MSPLGRTKSSKAGVSKTSEWTVKGTAKGLGLSGTRSVKVRVVDGQVRVTWLDSTECATRTFTVHGLRELITLVDGPGHRYRDMWLELNDANSYRSKFFLRVNEEGQLTANNSASEHGLVPWDSLKHAFEQALEELDSSS